MRLNWSVLIYVWICSVLALTSGCNGCSSDPLAELVSARGEVTRDHKASQNQWSPAAVGAEFEIGDALHTGVASGAEVRFDDGAALQLQQATTVRFLDVPPNSGELGLNIETGEAVLQTGGSMRLRTGIGLAVIEGGSVLRLTRSDRGLKFLVSVGLARLEGNGQSVELRVGEEVEVGIGMAILDRVAPAPTAAPEASVMEPESKTDLAGPISATISGKGASIQDPGSKQWRALPEGTHEVAPGSRLKLARNNESVIAREGQSATLAGPGTYLIGGQGLEFVQPELGNTQLEADGKDVTLVVPGGSITALGSQGPAAGTVVVSKGKQVSVRVARGQFRAQINGEEALLEAGEGLDANAKQFSVVGRGLTFADISTQAGEGLMIHDPAPPTAVRVQFQDKCAHRGVVELLKGKRVASTAAGTNSASLHFPKGTHTYQLRCLSAEGKLSAAMAQGRIVVYHDAGTAALAKHPPATSVNVDGRAYTVLYQNRLPAISVRWPNAPSANSYQLSVSSSGGPKKISTALPAHSFASGSLLEGQHRFTFRSGNGRSSRTSTVSIRFDNAAPKGSIQSPSDGSFGPGSSVRVSGMALPGWKVRVGGTTFPMDSQRRFSGQVTAGPRAVILRFEHETRGVHHYLRRASGIPR